MEFQKLVQFIRNYVHKSPVRTKPYYFVIDGNIASGKTTTINQLKSTLTHTFDSNHRVFAVEENVDTDGKQLLEKYLGNPCDHALEFQLWIVRNKLNQFDQILKQLDNDTVNIILIDRHILSDIKIFAKICYDKGFMTPDEKQTYDKLVMEYLNDSEIVSPDVCIYVRVPAEISCDRIHKRGRQGEDNYTREYIQELNELYDKLYTVKHRIASTQENFGSSCVYIAAEPYLSSSLLYIYNNSL